MVLCPHLTHYSTFGILACEVIVLLVKAEYWLVKAVYCQLRETDLQLMDLTALINLAPAYIHSNCSTCNL